MPDAEVVVIDERTVTTYPMIGQAAYTAIVTFRRGDEMPRTIFILLSDVAKEKALELLTQYNSKKGELYQRYLTYRNQKIRDDLQAAGAFKPETVRF